MLRNLSTSALGFWAPQNEQIELALSYGFKSIDLDIVDFAEQVESRTLAKARRLIDSAQIQLGAFRLPVPLDGDDETFAQGVTALGNQAQVAADVGCARAVVTLAAASDERPMHENFELHRARLGEVASVLDGCQIRLGVGLDAVAEHREGKQFEFIHDFEALSKLVDGVARDNVGFVVDPWQLHACGSDPDTISKLPLERMVYVNLANAPADKAVAGLTDEDRLSPKEEGALDLVALIKTLTEMNYTGPVTPVPWFAGYHGKRRDQAIKLIGLALDEVWVAAGLPRSLKAPPPPPPPPPETAAAKQADRKPAPATT